MTDLVIIADDLTGAGDSATLFAERAATGITLDGAASWPELPVLAVDTDSRYTTPTEAARRVAAAAERARGLGARAYKKIDSLLRGNVAAEVAAAARALGSAERPALAVVAPAFPSTGRTTVEGVVLVHGEPLPAPQHGRVAAVLAEADLTTAGAPLDRQGGPAALAELLASAWGDGVDAVVVDAVADKDLARVVQATAKLDFPVLLVGSGGLARPLRTLVPLSQAPSVAAADIQGPVLVVVGSYAEQARAQREELVRAGFGEVFLEPPISRPRRRPCGKGWELAMSSWLPILDCRSAERTPSRSPRPWPRPPWPSSTTSGCWWPPAERRRDPSSRPRE